MRKVLACPIIQKVDYDAVMQRVCDRVQPAWVDRVSFYARDLNVLREEGVGFERDLEGWHSAIRGLKYAIWRSSLDDSALLSRDLVLLVRRLNDELCESEFYYALESDFESLEEDLRKRVCSFGDTHSDHMMVDVLRAEHGNPIPEGRYDKYDYYSSRTLMSFLHHGRRSLYAMETSRIGAGAYSRVRRVTSFFGRKRMALKVMRDREPSFRINERLKKNYHGKAFNPNTEQYHLNEVRVMKALEGLHVTPKFYGAIKSDHDGGVKYYLLMEELLGLQHETGKNQDLLDFFMTINDLLVAYKDDPTILEAVEKIREDILGQIWRIVQLLHSLGLYHQDLKLENFILDEHGCVRLIDFSFTSTDLIRDDNRGTPSHVCKDKLFVGSYNAQQDDYWGVSHMMYAIFLGSDAIQEEGIYRLKLLGEESFDNYFEDINKIFKKTYSKFGDVFDVFQGKAELTPDIEEMLNGLMLDKIDRERYLRALHFDV